MVSLPLIVLLPLASALTAPNTSLATLPIAYFGGHKSPRGSGGRSDANLKMLSKMRIVMVSARPNLCTQWIPHCLAQVEKWEGHCYDECSPFKNGSTSGFCNPACAVESDMTSTLSKVKALNPSVTGIFYLNIFLLFPFYSLAGEYQAKGALLIDSETKKPVLLRNDESMPNIFVPDFGTALGRSIMLNAVQKMIAGGAVDGIFAERLGQTVPTSRRTAAMPAAA